MKTRNVLTILLLLSISIGFAGCGDDKEDNANTPSEMLVGKWKLVKIAGGIPADDSFLILNANGTFSKDDYDQRKECRVIVEGNYELLEDWTYDESTNHYTTVIQLGDSSTFLYYCALKEKEMILVLKLPGEWESFADPRQFYIKVEE
ncbi:MAG: hypothetical protein IJ604_02740 [Prevotella sp.]|nr:hypothetical protein [Prevotella sp.]MBR1462285.1 hypothetical protein [Prevotella sp.]